MEKITELESITPFWEDVGRLYDPSKERIKEQNYSLDQQLQKWKRCL